MSKLILTTPNKDQSSSENSLPKGKLRRFPKVAEAPPAFESTFVKAPPEPSEEIIDLLTERARRQELVAQEKMRRQMRGSAILLRKLEAARENPRDFYELVFTDDRSGPVTVKWFHEEWFELILQNRNVLLEAPRGCGKTIWMICCIIWHLGKNPNLRMKLLCEEDGKAKKRLAAIKELIEKNDMIRLVFPDLRLDYKKTNDKHTINLIRTRFSPEPSIEAKGIETSGTGDRADMMWMDDVIGYRNAIKLPTLRQEVKTKFTNDWKPTLNPRDGRIIGIFTPWHDEDLNNYLKQTTNWAYKRYCHGKPGNPFHSIFPELYPESKLRTERIEMGSIGYSRAYLCVAIASDVVLIQPDQLIHYTKDQLNMEDLQRATAILSIDPDSGKELHKGKDPDFTGVTVFLYIPPRHEEDWPRLCVVSSYQVRATINQQVSVIARECQQWHVQYILVEAEGMASLDQWVRSYQADNPESIKGYIVPITSGGFSKGQRLKGITPMIDPPEDHPSSIYFHPKAITPNPEEFYIDLPDGTSVEGMNNLRHQLLNFPPRHDDTVDSFVQGARWAFTNIFPKRPGEEVVNAGVDLVCF